MIGTEISGCAPTDCCPVKHQAKGWAFDIASMHAKSDDSPRELVHDNQDPVGFEENGLALEQIDAPKAVFMWPMKVSHEGPSPGSGR